MSHRILLIDDEDDILEFIRYNLTKAGYEVYTARNGAEGLQQAAAHRPHLILLDMMMPVMDGIETCRALRRDPALKETMVVFLSALGEEEQQLAGFGAGADDYITKPFSLAILRARVNAQLRRRVKFSCVELDGFRFDFERMAFWKNGEPIELSKTEQKLLRLLVENRGQTVSRGVLIDRIWTDGADFVDENALSVTVKRLRVKLEDDPSSPQYLKTVYGLGYTWAVK